MGAFAAMSRSSRSRLAIGTVLIGTLLLWKATEQPRLTDHLPCYDMEITASIESLQKSKSTSMLKTNLPLAANTEVSNYKDFPNITLMVRTNSIPKLTSRFYCMFLRTATMFWPASYGTLAVVLDAESKEDHTFGATLYNQMHKHFPEFQLKVYYEPLPRNKSTLTFNESARTPEYNRQMWSTFWADIYSNDPIIAYMDTDIQILTPMTKQYLFKGKKLKVLGEGKQTPWEDAWKRTTKAALGLPMAVNAMVTFPQLVYRDTFTNCRNFILRRFNTDNFEVAFRKLYLNHTKLCPICIIMTYAWYFEYERYDWHIKTPDRARNNEDLPEGHKILVRDTLPSIIGVSHMNARKTWRGVLVLPGYCMSLRVLGRTPRGCEGITHCLHLFCTYWEPFYRYPWPTADLWCPAGTMDACCREAMMKHYNTDVAQMVRHKVLNVDKKTVAVVEGLALDMGVECQPLILP